MNPRKVWQAALGELELQVSRSTFNTWLSGASLVACETDEYIIGVNSDFVRDWLEARMRTTIERTVAGIVGEKVVVSFVVWQQPDPANNPNKPEKTLMSLSEAPSDTSRYQQLPSGSFDDFVVSPGSRMAHAAALSVADHPLLGHNPLIIYGGVGLGKTHLLQAIANKCVSAGRTATLVTAETFTNELVSAIRSRTTESFRDKYRTTDTLLIDDIQFFVGKKASQEEFLHTLIDLYGENRQVVLACDQPPAKLTSLGQRICSRLVSGLTVKISPPDAEARASILRVKAEAFEEDVPDDVVVFLAERSDPQVRALEGALHRLIAQARVLGRPIDKHAASEAIGFREDRGISMAPSDQVISAVASHFKVSSRELCGKSRARRVTVPRHIAMHLLHEQGHCSLTEIGALLGGRDHSTVRHGCKSARSLLSRDTKAREHTDSIRDSLSRLF